MGLSNKEQLTKNHYDTLPFIEGGDQRAQWWKSKNREYLSDEDISNKRVLDVGCSRGEITKGLLERGAYVYGVDISFHSLLKFPDNPKLVRVNASALNLPFQDDSFDHSQSIGVLHHTPNAKKGFQELVRVTKGGGKIFIFLYSRYSLYHFLFLLARPLTKLIPLSWMPLKLLSFLTNATQLQQGYKLSSDQLKSLLGDAFWTPVATFHSRNEIEDWAKKEGLKILKSENYYLNCAYLYLFEKQKKVTTSSNSEPLLEELEEVEGIKKFL